MSGIPWLHWSCRHWVVMLLHSIPYNIVCEPYSPLAGYVDQIYRAYTERSAGNHTGYRQWKGTKTSAEEIRDLYTGLKQSYLTDFDVLLTGYIPSAEAVNAVGSIARDLKLKGSMKAGSFFWS